MLAFNTAPVGGLIQCVSGLCYDSDRGLFYIILTSVMSYVWSCGGMVYVYGVGEGELGLDDRVGGPGGGAAEREGGDELKRSRCVFSSVFFKVIRKVYRGWVLLWYILLFFYLLIFFSFFIRVE